MMIERRHSREDAIPQILFVDLYKAALDIEDEDRRLIAVSLVLLTGRLKMRISEAIHFHEGWLRRKFGLIRIPEFEPCICKFCFNQSGKNHKESDPYSSRKERHYNERYRTKNRRTRFVPYGWSPRIIACLEEYVERIGVFPYSHRTATRILSDEILPNAEYIDADDVDWSGMRATGDTFWAHTDLGLKERAEIGGHREAELGTYSGRSPIQLSNATRRAFGKEPLEFENFDIVASTPTPISGEPFPDPREVDPLENYDPLQIAPTFNPRSEHAPVVEELDRSNFNSRAIDNDMPTAEELLAMRQRFKRRFEHPPEEDQGIDPYAAAFEERDISGSDIGPGQSDIYDFTKQAKPNELLDEQEDDKQEDGNSVNAKIGIPGLVESILDCGSRLVRYRHKSKTFKEKAVQFAPLNSQDRRTVTEMGTVATIIATLHQMNSTASPFMLGFYTLLLVLLWGFRDEVEELGAVAERNSQHHA